MTNKIVKSLRIIYEDGFTSFFLAFAFFMEDILMPIEFLGYKIQKNDKKKFDGVYDFDDSFSLLFMSKNPLEAISDDYGTDKGGSYSPVNWDTHSYTPVYDIMFGGSNPDVILECGIGTDDPDKVSSMGSNYSPGASLRMWKNYFADSEIIGIDIDEKILFQEDGIDTYQVDQTNEESVSDFVTSMGGDEFEIDIVIDDGLHTANAALTLFRGLFPYLISSGTYVIEDLGSDHVQVVLDNMTNYDLQSVNVLKNKKDSMIIVRK